MVTFGSSDVGDNPPAGLRVLLDTYRTQQAGTITIGFAMTWSDRMLLRAVDVPVIVRNGHTDQEQLRNMFPDAFLTSAEGPFGWAEAILGRLAYELDGTSMMGARRP